MASRAGAQTSNVVPTRPSYSKRTSNNRPRPISNTKPVAAVDVTDADTDGIDSSPAAVVNNIPVLDDPLSPSTATNYAVKHNTTSNLQQVVQLILDANGIDRTTYDSAPHTIHTITIFQLYKFRSIDTHLHAFTGLQSLEIMCQSLTCITGLEHCTQLTTLRLSSNNITTIENLHYCTKLQHLYVDENKLTVLNNLDALCELQTLSAYDNQIHAFDITHNTNLTTLNLACNRISTVQNCLNNQGKLQELQLAENYISSFDDIRYITQTCPQLHTLSLCDPMYGTNPLCSLLHYNVYTLYLLSQTRITSYDNTAVTQQATQHANNVLLKKTLYYNLKRKSLQQAAKQLCTTVDTCIKNALLCCSEYAEQLQQIHATAMQNVNSTTERLVDDIDGEMNSAGNIRYEYCNHSTASKHAWYNSLAEHVKQHCTDNLTVQHAVKMHNQAQLNQFNDAVDTLTIDVDKYPYTIIPPPTYHTAYTEHRPSDTLCVNQQTTYHRTLQFEHHNTVAVYRVYDHSNTVYANTSNHTFQLNANIVTLPEYVLQLSANTEHKTVADNISSLQSTLLEPVAAHTLYHSVIDVLVAQLQPLNVAHTVDYANSSFTEAQQTQLDAYKFSLHNTAAEQPFTDALLHANSYVTHNNEQLTLAHYCNTTQQSVASSMALVHTVTLDNVIFSDTACDFILYIALQHLTLHKCGLTTLHSLQHCISLITLTVQHNALTTLDTAQLAKLRTLERLDVSHNAISTVSVTHTVPTLKYLNTEHNQVDTLHSLCQAFPNMVELFVQHNPLTPHALKQSVYHMQHCTALLIFDCDKQLCVAHSDMYYFIAYHCKSLQIVNECILSKQDTDTAEKMYVGVLNEYMIQQALQHTAYQHVRLLQLNNLKLRNVSVVTQALMPVLHTLDLCHNNLTDYSTLQPMHTLRVLKLSHNLLQKNTANRALNVLYKHIEHVECQHNKLTSLYQLQLQHCTQLRYIDVSHNSIDKVDDSDLHGCTAVTTLLCNKNSIKAIQNTAFQACRTTLNQLNLEHNLLRTPHFLIQYVYDRLQTCLLAYNRVHTLNEVQQAAEQHLLPKLAELSLRNTFLQRQPMTRLQLIYMFRTCTVIDAMPVSEAERQRAETLFAPQPEPTELADITNTGYFQQPLQVIQNSKYGPQMTNSVKNAYVKTQSTVRHSQSIPQSLSLSITGQSVQRAAQPVFTPISAVSIQPVSTKLQYLTLNGLSKRSVSNKR